MHMVEFGNPRATLDLSVTLSESEAKSSVKNTYVELIPLPPGESASNYKSYESFKSKPTTDDKLSYSATINFENASYEGLMKSILHVRFLTKDKKSKSSLFYKSNAVLNIKSFLQLSEHDEKITTELKFDICNKKQKKIKITSNNGSSSDNSNNEIVGTVEAKVTWENMIQFAQMIGGVYKSSEGIVAGKIVPGAIPPYFIDEDSSTIDNDPTPSSSIKTQSSQQSFNQYDEASSSSSSDSEPKDSLVKKRKNSINILANGSRSHDSFKIPSLADSSPSQPAPHVPSSLPPSKPLPPLPPGARSMIPSSSAPAFSSTSNETPTKPVNLALRKMSNTPTVARKSSSYFSGFKQDFENDSVIVEDSKKTDYDNPSPDSNTPTGTLHVIQSSPELNELPKEKDPKETSKPSPQESTEPTKDSPALISLNEPSRKSSVSVPRKAALSRKITSKLDESNSVNSSANARSVTTVGDYDIYEELGKGQFGIVYHGIHKTTKKSVAVKEIKLNPQDHKLASNVMREAEVLQSLTHENILQIFEVVKVPKKVFFILEYCENGSIFSKIKKSGVLQEPEASVYIKQLLCGLDYLHGNSVIHRDIKCGNLLLNCEGKLKLADFGTAKFVDKNQYMTVIGSPYWMAPEIIEMSGGNEISDIWSVGCTIIEMLTGKPPYFEMPPMSALYQIVESDHPPMPSGISKDLEDFLVNGCLVKDIKTRKNAKTLLTHVWIQKSK
eukprot:TRINITY_DN5531_c0_g1_i2.p1 TRINITY_DN5531_c0_g1~~TRINITY_DN5531_c0_g1_i2.p1  ORF type:complete len:726 (+),score=161.36 TRINITY_DN5531_c0_g1_i2:756-2933(+)